MSPDQWHEAKYRLRMRLDTWARIIVFRAENPGELYPQMAHWEEKGTGWKTRKTGAAVNPLMSDFIEVEMVLKNVPIVIQGIWVRMYGGREVVKARKAVRMVEPECDVEAMMAAVNAWEARIADRLGILNEVMG